MPKKTVNVGIIGGDQVQLEVELDGDSVQSTHWQVIGRLSLVEKARELKKSLKGAVSSIAVPNGRTPEDLILRELILKLKGEWPAGPQDPELCHCRKIPQTLVERGVILGADSVEKVRQRTSANTGCGTCMPDVEEVLKRYLG